MEPGGQPFPLTVLKGGINRLRTKGGANPAALYDLVNAFINIEGNVQQRDGSIREQLLDSTTIGLVWFNGAYQIFGNNTSAFTPAGFNLNVLVNPAAEGQVTITNASPAVCTFPAASGVLFEGAQVQFSVSSGGALPAPLVAGTTYYAKDVNGTVFHIAATQGGTPINTTNAGSGTFGATVFGTDTLQTILFAQPFMGFLFVVARFASGKIQHYWLQSSGAWAANTVYQAGAIVTPTPPNGLAYLATRQVPVNPTWAPEIAVAVNQLVEPTVPNGYFFKATTVVGTTPRTGQVEPKWPTSIGGTVQEFGDYAITSTPPITNTAAAPLATSITDRYGDSSDIAGLQATATSAGAVSVLPPANSNITTWAAGTLYPTGSVVRPSTNQGAVINAIPNGDFEAGSDGNWVNSGSGQAWVTDNSGPAFQGSFAARNKPGATGAFYTMNTVGLTSPGTTVTANAMLSTGASGGSDIVCSIGLNWYSDAGGTVLISSTDGGAQSSKGGYKKIQVTGVAPAGTKSVKVYLHAASGTATRDTAVIDLVQWNLETPSATTLLVFEAIQAGTATSGGVEPTWPTVIGNTVVDGGVTWQAIGTSIVTWTGSPIMLSGGSQPAFPTTIGQQVYDGNMSWTAIARNITDPKDPQTAAVAIAASHVFAGDKDICDYSAAVDPTDWSSPNNAGYLPTGLNNYGSNPVAAIGLYRGNLVVMNSAGYQMWQVDPDPANMALLDAQPVGCTHPRSIQSIANDLLFLSVVGVRNIGTTGATANMQTGMLGQPIDALVLAQLKAGIYDPISFYYPARGQYWLIFGPQAFVLTVNGNNQKSWSRYTFPDAITDVTLNGEQLVFRTALGYVALLDPNTVVDFAPATNATSTVSIASNADSHFSQVSLLLPMDGTASSTSFPDLSPVNNTMTASNGANVETSHVVFGSGAMFSNGTNSNLNTPLTASGPLDLSTGDFTVEGWFWSNINNNNLLVDASNGAVNGFFIEQTLSTTFAAFIWTGVGGFVALSGSNSLSAFHHVALVRSGNNFVLYIDGVGTAPLNYSGSIGPMGGNFNIAGGFRTSLDGFVDEVRVTKGFARYTSNFTPPAAAFPTTGVPNGIVNWTAHGMVNGTLVYFTTTGTLPAPLQPNTLYYVVGATTNAFEVSLEPPGFGVPIQLTTAGTGTHTAHNVGVPYIGVMQWPYLDLSRLGLNKELVGFDIVGTGSVAVLFGWDETDVTSFNDNAGFLTSKSVTPEIILAAADTLPGQPIPVPLNAPSYSPILLWGGNQAWTWNAFSIYASTIPSAG